jgi:crotonobetainyl-CoA:carnitine CoA-transferase CaiB-like acyl-CoA transferase
MPGLGSTGPLSGYGTWGPTLTAYSGLTYLWNHPGQDRPVGSQGVYPDYLTGEMVTDRGAGRADRAPAHRRRAR